MRELRQAPCCRSSVSPLVFLAFAGITCACLLLYAKLSMLNSHRLIDIDIGTNGVPMASKAHKLITFDPGDSQLLSASMERYPFVIADFNGEAIFYVNEDEPGCSSLNLRNDNYNQTKRLNQMKRRCPKSSFEASRLRNCMHSKRIRQETVQVRQLSSFLKARKVTRVNRLKIDAQGSDFAIVKDLFENADHVAVNVLQVECQDYGNSIPLYFTSNNCADIVRYAKKKRPNMVHSLVENNCMAAEYNLVLS